MEKRTVGRVAALAAACMAWSFGAWALELEAEFNPADVSVGDALNFEVRATEGGQAVSGLTGTAVLGLPDETIESATLAEGAPGVYRATFTATVPGKYLGKTKLNGETAWAYAAAMSGAARFGEIGAADPTVADEDGDGMWNRLSVAGTLTGADDGAAHRVYGELLDQDGGFIGSAAAELAAGETSFRLDFDGHDIFMANGGNQVYEVSPLRLEEGDYGELDARDGQVFVDGTAWPRESFEHAPLTVMYGYDWLTFSARTNTLYDLMVTLAVDFDAEVAGTYECRGKLVADDGTELGEGTGRAIFDAWDGAAMGRGYVDFRFDGGPICDSGIDGPWTVTDLTFDGRSVTVMMPTFTYRTGAWLADDMDGEGVEADIAWKYLKATGTWFAQVRVEFLKGREQAAEGLRFLFADRKGADGSLLAGLWSSWTRAPVAQTEVIDGVVYRVVQLDVNAARLGQGTAVYGVSDLAAAGIPVAERVIEMYVARRVSPEVGNEAAAGVDDFTAWLAWEANGETHRVAVPALAEPEEEEPGDDESQGGEPDGQT